MSAAPILLLTKTDVWSQHAAALVRAMLGDGVLWAQGRVGDPPPQAFSLPAYAAVISFLSPWIVPAEVLERSELSINFHPGSCEYPGIGCYNFALYEAAAMFGAVCHHMLPKVDRGRVIAETLFPVLATDTVETLKLRTMVAMLSMTHEMVGLIAQGMPLPVQERQWARAPFTRAQLDALCEVTEAMSEEEAKRRVRATTYPGYPGPYLLKDGKKHFYPVPQRPAVA